MTIPAIQMNKLSPTLPERENISLGVANIPVPIMRLKMRNIADVSPIWRLEELV